jgi:hypothetical protein
MDEGSGKAIFYFSFVLLPVSLDRPFLITPSVFDYPFGIL